MIFITVGTQLPFDRMVRAVDEWAGRSGRRDVFGQIGPSSYRAHHIQTVQFLGADECRQRLEQADVVVAHAGMGSVISALELGKPIVVMPRRAEFGEHRNDHQLATARWLSSNDRIATAFDDGELCRKLEQLVRLRGSTPIASHASPELIRSIQDFINSSPAADAGGRGTGLFDSALPLSWLRRRSKAAHPPAECSESGLVGDVV